MAFFKGLLTGLTTLVFVGPVFFTLLKNSLSKGTPAGLATAFGIFVSDILVLFICYFLAAELIDNYINHPYVKFFGASILLAFGFVFYFRPVKELESKNSGLGKGRLKAFSQGFLVNFANPTVFVVWVGFIILGQSMYDNSIDLWIYFIGILMAIWSTDSLKAFGAAKVKPYLKSSNLQLIFKVIGIIVVGSGLYLAYQGFAQYM